MEVRNVKKLQAVLSVCHGSSIVYSEIDRTENGYHRRGAGGEQMDRVA